VRLEALAVLLALVPTCHAQADDVGLEIMRLCVSTDSRIQGWSAASDELNDSGDIKTSRKLFEVSESRYSDDAKLFRLAAGLNANSVIVGEDAFRVAFSHIRMCLHGSSCDKTAFQSSVAKLEGLLMACKQDYSENR
jgi:hypothetical protein